MIVLAGPAGVLDVSYEAQEDLSNYQYAVVVHGTADGTMRLPAGTNAGRCLGILLSRPISGTPGRVRKYGLSLAVAAGDISRGDPLEVADPTGAVRVAQAGVGTLIVILSTEL